MNRADELHRAYRTVQEIAKLLGVSDKQVRTRIKEGDLPGFKFGREYRVSDDELAAWIENHRIERDEGVDSRNR
jgi:excisionase family DNA binding protein